MATDNEFIKDPNEVLDYKFDFKAATNQADTNLGDWLAGGETIASYTVTAATGLTKDSDSKTDGDTSVTVWLSGGTLGAEYTVTCQIVTSASRTAERDIVVKMQNR